MRVLAFLASTLLAGCAHQAVLDLGGGRYSLTATAHVHCVAGSREEAVEDANDFCAAKHAKAVIGNFEDIPSNGFDGCTTSVVFTCEGN